MAANSQHVGWLVLKNAEGDHEPIPFAKTKTQPPIFANELGILELPKTNLEQLTITAWNFSDTTIILSQLPQKDTAIIYMRPQPEQLDEVLVNPKNSWLQNHIYGFERWYGGWIFMFSKEIAVTDDKLDVRYKTVIPPLEGKSKKELFVDALNNIYLVGKDSVQQVYVTDSTLYVYPPKSRQMFDYLIKPLLAQTSVGMIYRETQAIDYDIAYAERTTGAYFEFNVVYPPYHNWGAELILKGKDPVTSIYRSIDTVGYKQAAEAFTSYAQNYMLWWREFEITGSWLNPYHEAFGRAKNTYNAVHANYKKLYFLPFESGYVYLDRFGKSKITFSANVDLLLKTPFSFEDCPPDDYLYVDQATGKWWLQRRVRGLDQLESVRPNDPPQSITLDPFVRNIRVYNNTVFYINERGQFRVLQIE